MFDGTKMFNGYVVDVCNAEAIVGSKKFYGFWAHGTSPNIQIATWGFD